MIQHSVRHAGIVEIVRDRIRTTAHGVALGDPAMPAIDRESTFRNREEARDAFTRISGLYRNRNDGTADTSESDHHRQQIEQIAATHA